MPQKKPAAEQAVRVGCTGWTIPRGVADQFLAEGSHLQRYSRRFPCVEINSSFYRPHQRKTYERWGHSVPADFRFSVKVPKQITHELRFVESAEPLENFLEGVTGLGERLGCLLVQLPPSFPFDGDLADSFFSILRRMYRGPVAFEPRHATWFDSEVETLLREHRISRVAADPPPAPGADVPGGFAAVHYYRLHGAPRVYYSEYSEEFLASLAEKIRAAAPSRRHQPETWCIFDNTALSFATPNALRLQELLRELPVS